MKTLNNSDTSRAGEDAKTRRGKGFPDAPLRICFDRSASCREVLRHGVPKEGSPQRELWVEALKNQPSPVGAKERRGKYGAYVHEAGITHYFQHERQGTLVGSRVERGFVCV